MASGLKRAKTNNDKRNARKKVPLNDQEIRDEPIATGSRMIPTAILRIKKPKSANATSKQKQNVAVSQCAGIWRICTAPITPTTARVMEAILSNVIAA